MNIKRYNLSKNNIKITKTIINDKGKINNKVKINGGVHMENTTRRLDFSKLNFSDKVISTKEALKDVLPFNLDKDTNIIVTGINKK